MYLYEIKINDTIQTLDNKYRGRVTRIEQADPPEDSPQDRIYCLDTMQGEVPYLRWMVRLVPTRGEEPPF